MEKQGEKYDRYSYEELSAFCLQIALLLEAAVPLEEGLTIMAEDAAEEKEKAMHIYMAEGGGRGGAPGPFSGRFSSPRRPGPSR